MLTCGLPNFQWGEIIAKGQMSPHPHPLNEPLYVPVCLEHNSGYSLCTWGAIVGAPCVLGVP